MKEKTTEKTVTRSVRMTEKQSNRFKRFAKKLDWSLNKFMIVAGNKFIANETNAHEQQKKIH